MKRMIAILLCLALMMVCFTGCEAADDPQA